jgi:Zn-dependent protease
MFPARIRLFSLLGFSISADISWFFLAFYLIFTLTTWYFPVRIPLQGFYAYFAMGLAGAAGFFLSIVLHELAHAVIARGFGLPIGSITLFIFGGVAELRQEPQTPRAEFWVAIAGPIASTALASLYFAGKLGADAAAWKEAATVLEFLAWTNTILALFNLVPAFPLDGGRVLRSILWWQTGNLRRATRIAAMLGSVFGFLLIAFGASQLFAGNWWGGPWLILIGIFLAIAAAQARGETEAALNLKGVSVADLMDSKPKAAGPDITIDTLVSDYLYRLNSKFFAIVEDGLAIGYVGPKEIKQIPQSQWHDTFVRAIAARFTHDTVVSPAAPAFEALRKLTSNGIGYLAVLDGSKLLGTVSETNFVNYFSVREALEAGGTGAAGPAPSCS